MPFFINPTPGTVVSPVHTCVSEQNPAHFEPMTTDQILEKRMALLLCDKMTDKNFKIVSEENMKLNILGKDLLTV